MLPESLIARLRASALYLLAYLCLVVAVSRTLVITLPLLQASDVAEQQADQFATDAWRAYDLHRSLGEAMPHEPAYAADRELTAEAVLGFIHRTCAGPRAAVRVALVKLTGLLLLLALGSGVYLAPTRKSLAEGLLVSTGSLFLGALWLACWHELTECYSHLWQGLSQVLTSPHFLPVASVLGAVLLVLAVGYDFRRRRPQQRPLLLAAPVPAVTSFSTQPAKDHSYVQSL